MADNLEADPGAGGATFATDDIAGVHFPRSKIVWGEDGTATDTAAGAAAIPIQDGGNTITVDGTVELGATALAALETITVASVTAPLAAGTNNIGDVDVLTLPALPAGTNNIGDVDVLTIAAGDNNIGNVDVVTLPALVAGTANIGDVDVLTLPATPTGTNTIGNVGLAPRTSGGLSVSRLISAASTNETEAKATPGQVYGVIATNINAAVRYLKLYDNTAAGTTIGTTTPKMTIAIPGNAAGAGIVFMIDQGIAFGTGITYGTTTGAADADTGAVAANEIIVQVLFA